MQRNEPAGPRILSPLILRNLSFLRVTVVIASVKWRIKLLTDWMPEAGDPKAKKHKSQAVPGSYLWSIRAHICIGYREEERKSEKRDPKFCTIAPF
jgi:hypothetical protein